MSAPMVVMYIFTDPMMGLSYESEPVLRKLETHLGDQIKFEYVMSLLVRDVHDFMNQAELSLPFEEGIIRYNQRLAQIYKDEESISGMPINMDGFRLFSISNRTSLPLNLAYLAVKRLVPEKAEQFLYLLRYRTIVECRPTTEMDELCATAEMLCIDRKTFMESFNSQAVLNDLNRSLEMRISHGIRGLPAYMFEYENRRVIIRGVADYSHLVDAVLQVSNHTIAPSAVTANQVTLRNLIAHHPLISPIEIREALDLPDISAVQALVHPLIQSGECMIRKVTGGWFVEGRRVAI